MIQIGPHNHARGIGRVGGTIALAGALLVSTFGVSSAAARDLDPSVPGSAAAPDQLVVATEDGLVRGVRDGRAQAFLGIPFAAPPVGELRFAPPAPVQGWQGVRDADEQGPACIQFQPGGVRETQATSEDCLYLDVYRPQGTKASDTLPVLVWTHGGGFTQGTGVIYGGQTLASRTNSIVVSINYRLGAYGFLSHEDLDAAYPSVGSGNWGILDQVAALAWVNRNITAFGGDPERVTTFGQSAGGASVCVQLASPLAAGLFSQAVIQSAFCGLGENALPTAQARGEQLVADLGCTGEDPIGCLRAASDEQIVAASQGLRGPTTGTPTLPLASREAISSGTWNRVPVIVGAVASEGKLFLAGNPDITAEQYQAWLDSFGPMGAEIGARYPLSDYASPFYAQSQAFGDMLIYCAAERTADLLATETTVWRYEFDDPDSPTLYGFQPEGIDMSNTHSAELAYLFDFTLGYEPIPGSSKRLATQMQRYWGSLAADADPNDPGLPYWPQYTPSAHQTLLLQPGGTHVITDASQRHNCDLWNAMAG